jgi:hypothetical protein
MGAMQNAAKATAPGPAQPAPGPDAAWTQSILSRFERRQRRVSEFDRRRPWVLFVTAMRVHDLREGGGRSPFGNADERDALPAVVPYLFAVATIVRPQPRPSPGGRTRLPMPPPPRHADPRFGSPAPQG